MNIQEVWEKAVKTTQVIRARVQSLETFTPTRLPYVFLSESLIHPGDTVVRRGEVLVEKSSIVLPQNMTHFEGFDFEQDMHVNEDFLKSFFLVRGITFPSLKYAHKAGTLDLYEGRLDRAIEHYGNRLAREEDVHTGLVTGFEDVWQFAILIFIGGQVVKNAEGDIKRLFDDYHRRGMMS